MGLLDTAIKKQFVSDPTLGYDDTRMYNPGYVGWGDLYNYYKSSKYDNVFPYIDLIATTFAKQEHYMLDKKGEQTIGDESTGSANLFARTMYPNDSMSDYDFREAMAILALFDTNAMWRVHGKTTSTRGKNYILPKDVKGFTPLIGVATDVVDGEVIYRLPNGEKLQYHQIWVDKDFNPESLHLGYNATKAAESCIMLDDYMVSHQKGYFQNGAVGAGMYDIVAKSPNDYLDIKNGILSAQKGVGKNNNVIFNYTPVEQDGKPGRAQIQWIPFNVQNKDLALKDLFDQVDKKIKQKFRIPPSMVGDSENNNLSSAQIDRKNFAVDVMEGFTLKRWSRFNLSMNRITGGFGGAITAKVDIPAISEEKKFEAETRQINATTVASLTEKGFTAESAIAYVMTGDVSKLVEKPKEVPQIVVPDREDITDTPEMPVDNLHQTNKHTHVSKDLDIDDRQNYEEQLSEAVKGRLSAQVNKAMELIKSKAISVDEPIDASEDTQLTDDMLKVITSAVVAQGAIEHKDQVILMAEFGIDATDTADFEMTGAQRAEYRKYVEVIAKGFNEQTAEKIRNIIVTGREQGLSAADMKNMLRELVDEDWRIDRLTRTEIQRAGNQSSVLSMQNISEELGVKVYKVWRNNSGSPCDYCRKMSGSKVLITEDFMKLGDSVEAEGGIYTNNWSDLSSAQLHANCSCSQYYEVERG